MLGAPQRIDSYHTAHVDCYNYSFYLHYLVNTFGIWKSSFALKRIVQKEGMMLSGK
jgi:hypothetical protein